MNDLWDDTEFFFQMSFTVNVNITNLHVQYINSNMMEIGLDKSIMLDYIQSSPTSLESWKVFVNIGSSSH